MKRITTLLTISSLLFIIVSCQTGDLSINPNAAGTNSLVNLSLFLNRLDNEIYNGGGVMDGYSNNQPEGPWNQVQRWNQYFVSNYSYYWGSNFYNWTNTATHYGMLKYAVLMEQQAKKQGAANPNQNAYLAIAKFYKAYSFIWMTQRVGDIPMTEAGSENNLTPKFDKQHDVYQKALAMLDTANTLIGNYNATASPLAVAGGIYGLSNVGWQKVINTYKLRVLISLSKRADDNADLNIKGQFAAILANPIKYPIMTSNADNMAYKFNAAFNPYPLKVNGNQPYSLNANISNTYLNLTTSVSDPRTFLVATPAPAQIAAGKSVGDFTAYVGSDMNAGQSVLLVNSTNGMYSFSTFRYFTTTNSDGSLAEPAIIIGYSEMCFNIAEAINRGWAPGSSSTWYNNGINASLAMYKITNGQVLTISDKAGTTLGTTVVNLPLFMANVAYVGDTPAGLTQILQQKYVSMCQNSGMEAYYNFRRTGIPAFAQGGSGIGTSNNLIPKRWIYPNDEIVANASNYQSALQNQGFGTDDPNAVMWLLK